MSVLDRGLAGFFDGPVELGHGERTAVGVCQDHIGRHESLSPQVLGELPLKPFDELRRRERIQLDAAIVGEMPVPPVWRSCPTGNPP